MEHLAVLYKSYGYWFIFLAVLSDGLGAPPVAMPILLIAGGLAVAGKMSLGTLGIGSFIRCRHRGPSLVRRRSQWKFNGVENFEPCLREPQSFVSSVSGLGKQLQPFVFVSL